MYKLGQMQVRCAGFIIGCSTQRSPTWVEHGPEKLRVQYLWTRQRERERRARRTSYKIHTYILSSCTSQGRYKLSISTKENFSPITAAPFPTTARDLWHTRKRSLPSMENSVLHFVNNSFFCLVNNPLTPSRRITPFAVFSILHCWEICQGFL